jgi:hypothetical protein
VGFHEQRAPGGHAGLGQGDGDLAGVLLAGGVAGVQLVDRADHEDVGHDVLDAAHQPGPAVGAGEVDAFRLAVDRELPALDGHVGGGCGVHERPVGAAGLRLGVLAVEDQHPGGAERVGLVVEGVEACGEASSELPHQHRLAAAFTAGEDQPVHALKEAGHDPVVGLLDGEEVPHVEDG